MMIRIPQHPKFFDNRDRVEADKWPCIVCGKGIDPHKAKAWVRVWYGTEIVTSHEAIERINVEGTGGDLGYYPIGSDCLRNHPEIKEYTQDVPTC